MDKNTFDPAVVNMAMEPSLPNTTSPSIDGLTGIQWCEKHGLKIQFDLPAIRISDEDGNIVGIAYSANSEEGLIDAIKTIKKT